MRRVPDARGDHGMASGTPCTGCVNSHTLVTHITHAVYRMPAGITEWPLEHYAYGTSRPRPAEHTTHAVYRMPAGITDWPRTPHICCVNSDTLAHT